MNKFIKRKTAQVNKDEEWGRSFLKALLYASPLIAIAVGIFIWFKVLSPSTPDEVFIIEQELPYSVDIALHAVDPIELVVYAVADSYGVPAAPMLRLSEYLQQDRFDGVGLFSIKPGHVDWVRDSLLMDTIIDLEDPIQNTQIAAFLLRRFMDSGYSVEESFLIYVYGFTSLSNREQFQDFLTTVFLDGE